MKKIDNNLIDAYTTEMKESGYNSNNSYVQIATIDYAETKYQEISKQLEQEDVENREELVKKQQEYNQLRLNMDFLGIDLSKVPYKTYSNSQKFAYNSSSEIPSPLPSSRGSSGVCGCRLNAIWLI